jgi:hypothetical protein
VKSGNRRTQYFCAERPACPQENPLCPRFIARRLQPPYFLFFLGFLTSLRLALLPFPI